MLDPLRRLTIRTRLVVLALTVLAALAGLGAAAISTTSSMTAASGVAADDEHALEVLSHAYEAWILDDDQSNMYAAVLALRDPRQHQLAETTWAQAASAYRDASAQLALLRRLVTSASESRALARIDASLSSYNAFSVQLRRDGLAGRVLPAVHVMTVDNLVPSNALPLEFTTLRSDLELGAQASTGAVSRTASSGTSTLLEVMAVVLPLVIALLLLTGRAIGSSLQRLLSAVDRIAAGDLDDHDPHAAGGDEIDRATAQLRSRLLDYLRPVTAAAEAVASGNLAVRVTPSSERDKLGAAFAAMLDSLRQLVTELGTAGTQVANASRGLANASGEAGNAVSEIASAIGAVAEGAGRQVVIVDQARAAVAQTAETAGLARGAAEDGIAAAREASGAMSLMRDSGAEVTGAIEVLSEKSEQIGGISRTISDLASQTNLLALNAAIEAARAGEHGSGFAVVAEEVGKLAEQSRRAAGSIADLIAEIQIETTRTVAAVAQSVRRSEEGAEVVERAGEAFGRIGVQIADIVARVGEIATASGQIAAVADEASATTVQVSSSTQQTSASTQEIAASARELAGTAATLQDLVAQFRLAA